MKKIISIACGAMLACTAGLAIADGHEGASVAYPPMETFTCSYNEGKGPADMDAATAAWNEYMDERGVEYYFAATVTPYYYGPETFQVGWIGSWSDGNAMGQGTDQWLAEGGEIAAGFAEVVTCDSHSNFVVDMIRAPGEGTPDTFVLTFVDCNMNEGTEYDAMRAAMVEWTGHRAENGHEHPMWLLWPAYGGGGAEFDFKIMNGYRNHSEMGSEYEYMGTGGGWRSRMEIMGDMIECDDARVYNGTTRRKMGGNDD